MLTVSKRRPAAQSLARSRTMRVLRSALVAAAAILPMTGIAAKAEFPDRPIKIVVPFPAGGPTDVAGRLVAQALQKQLGATVIIENIGGAGGAARPVGVDRVAQVVAAQGMAAPYRLNLPRDSSGTYIVFSYPDQPEGQRTLYVDQYSGEVLDDVRFADYGIAAKAVELGVQLHMGNYFGRLNQIVMLVPCLGIIVLALTGPYMWWRRRPNGRLGAPKVLVVPSLRTLAILVLGMGLVFPLAGASLLICLLVDHFARRPWRRLARMG